MTQRSESSSGDQSFIWAARGKSDRGLSWRIDPVAESLEASYRRLENPADGAYPHAFCHEVGRRLLLAQMQMNSWILRRVEKVDLNAEQAARRRVTLELVVPRDAPLFIDVDERRLRCVPLSVLRRRTLIGLDIRDEDGKAICLPGLRMTQSLDQSLLLAAVASSPQGMATDDLVAAAQDWASDAISGPLEKVRDAYVKLSGEQSPMTQALGANPLFMHVAHRMRHNFTLYAFLDEDDGRHRLISISFEEPTDWRYQRPTLEPEPGSTEPLCYAAGTPEWSLRGSLGRFGLRSTRIRFQVPGAESAASFHFELAAPRDVQIVRATLLAGRPNAPPHRRPSFDRVLGHSPTVGLHAVEVPHGSLCRVQADFRVSARGWLSTMVIATLAILALMVTVAIHSRHRSQLGETEVTNAILLLVTAVAAAAALVAQRDFVGMAARFVTGVRAVVTATLALPIIAAGFLAFRGPSELFSDDHAFAALLVLTALSFFAFILTAVAWGESWWRERRKMFQESPWDMTEPGRPASPRRTKKSQRLEEAFAKGYLDVVRHCKFNTPAVGVASAEGWYGTYEWDDEKQSGAVEALQNGLREPCRCQTCTAWHS